jgi:hypothetical protein
VNPLRPPPPLRGTSPKYAIENLHNYSEYYLADLGEAGGGLRLPVAVKDSFVIQAALIAADSYKEQVEFPDVLVP